MGAFKATLIGVSVLALVAVVETDALARGAHHHGREVAPRGASGGEKAQSPLHNVLSYDDEGGGKASAAPADTATSHMRAPTYGEQPAKGSNLTATSRGDVTFTGATSRGDVTATSRGAPLGAPTAPADTATSHMRAPTYGEQPAKGSDLTATSRGDVTFTAATSRGDVAATSRGAPLGAPTAPADTATSHMRAPTTYGEQPAKGSDLTATSRGDVTFTGATSRGAASAADLGGSHVPTKGGAYIEGQAHEGDVATYHPESVVQ